MFNVRRIVRLARATWRCACALLGRFWRSVIVEDAPEGDDE